MASATVTSKGQVTIPADVRARLGLRPGSRLAFVPTGTGGFEIHPEVGQGSQGSRAEARVPGDHRGDERRHRRRGGRPVIGLDTNVVVRYLVQDDPGQAAVASALVERLTDTEPGYLSLVTVVETFWVLRSAYGVDAEHCADLVEGLLDARELRVDRAEVVRAVIPAARRGLDLADAVVAELGRAAGCNRTVTFDRKAARDGAMRLLG
jgi:AbrB family looped-hinge helix DNA binding protein